MLAIISPYAIGRAAFRPDTAEGGGVETIAIPCPIDYRDIMLSGNCGTSPKRCPHTKRGVFLFSLV
jgi:hypothetical protein